MRLLRRMRTVEAVAAVLTVTSCTIFPWHRNTPLRPCVSAAGQHTSSNSPDPPASRDGRFVALAFSGGGNRAANFGAAMLYQLNQLGILDDVNYVSSASGGSLPAAYFVLARADLQRAGRDAYKKKMSKGCLQAKFRRDFQERWLTEWFVKFPLDLVSAHTRTDLMADTLNQELFTDSRGQTGTFADLPESPKLFINATDLAEGSSFSFSYPTFSDQLCSDLGSLPIGTAVAASAAFPGAFRSVALEKFGNRGGSGETQYVHLFDAGVSDNLAIESLTNEFGRLSKTSHGRDIPCMIISVDAFQPLPEVARYESKPKVKKWYDLGIDITTVDRSASVQLQHHREHELRDLGYGDDQISGQFNNGVVREQLATDGFPKSPPTGVFSHLKGCMVWHADLASWSKGDYLGLYTSQYKSSNGATPAEQAYEDFVHRMTSYPTDFSVVDDDHLRDFYAAAWLKVNQSQTKQQLCEDYRRVTGKSCKSTVTPEAIDLGGPQQSGTFQWLASGLEYLELSPGATDACN